MSPDPSLDPPHSPVSSEDKLVMPPRVCARIILATEQEAFEAIALAWYLESKESDHTELQKSDWRLVVNLGKIKEALTPPDHVYFFKSPYTLRHAFTRLMRANIVEKLPTHDFLVTQDGIAAIRDCIRGNQDKYTLKIYGEGLYRRTEKDMENALNEYRKEISKVLDIAKQRFGRNDQ